jgi:hypothetical protein
MKFADARKFDRKSGVRFGEPGAPVRLPRDRFVPQTSCATTWVELIEVRLYSGNSWILQHL